MSVWNWKKMAAAFAAGLIAVVLSTPAADAQPGRWKPSNSWLSANGAPTVWSPPRHRPTVSAATRPAAYDGGAFGCHGDVVGAVLGGLAGAGLGSQVGKGDGKTAAIIGGAVLGIMLGGHLGEGLNGSQCLDRTMDTVPDGHDVVWTQGPDGAGSAYTLTPVATYANAAGHTCRDYRSTAWIDGRRQTVRGTACKTQQGWWIAG